MTKLTTEEAQAIIQRENGRVGLEVRDQQGRSYWITDVLPDDRLRVTGEDGRDFWWNPVARIATPVLRKHAQP